MSYFNYRIQSVEADSASYWERRDFLKAWWAQYEDDNRWTPPDYHTTRRELDPRHNGHLARLRAKLVFVEALARTGVRRGRTGQQELPLTSLLERPLATAAPLIDPRRKGRTAQLAMLALSADDEAFDRLYSHLVETLQGAGYRRMIGPVGLSPFIGTGVLTDSWDEWPPLHTPGNPPYLPDLLARHMRPFQTATLYRLEVPPGTIGPVNGPATVQSFDPARLAADLLPLLVAATENVATGFPPPDAVEAAYLLRLLGADPLIARLLTVEGEPVGFVLMGPDTAARYRTLGGGRRFWARGALSPARRRPVRSARVYFGTVLPAWRGRGIGRQLRAIAVHEAQQRGWRRLTIGPLWGGPDAPALGGAFLTGWGAEPGQSFALYEASF